MDLLKEIYEHELGIGDRNASSNRHGGRYWFIRTSVGIVYNERYQVAFIRRADGGVGLPAGPSGTGQNPLDEIGHGLISGAETEEEKQHLQTLRLSELNELGLVIEYLDELESMRFSYGYSACATVHGSGTQVPDLEVAKSVVWLPPQEAIAKLKRQEPATYEEKFVKARDLALLHHLLQFG